MRASSRRGKALRLLAALVAGGTLFGNCQMRMKNSLVDGTKTWFFGLLDPSNLLQDSDLLAQFTSGNTG
jgi:hypothetical protein